MGALTLMPEKNEPTDVQSQSPESTDAPENTTDNHQSVYDPIREGAKIIAGDDFQAIEHRLKTDIFASL